MRFPADYISKSYSRHINCSTGRKYRSSRWSNPIGKKSIIISLKRLNLIRAVDFFNRTLIAEAGCTLIELQKVIEKNNLFSVRFFFKRLCILGGS